MARGKRQAEQQTIPATADVVALAVAPEEPAPVPVTRWQVMATSRVSLFGHLTYLHAGTVIALSEYGPEGIERIRDQGVVLEPMV